ncbi:MAG TPA: glutamine--fructose-6-phosphate transaminase (isomerizing) [Candidatus Paceibacterota bacterium]|mgnify:CR=1 FL=1|jgi:glucosamine--fructose-6-phosphate aminotransferase (isomerizing)|nr:glutamine--fructose-6-phosphate transaminase (isomerizing) [Candidatus Paceibacterota bacterium]HRS48002.1 glutamine--fructose-6-phosphate transaminase (isomerizing) [Candidatus Paceibacterota bacterium]
MCGIIGYIGKKSALPIVVKGLEKMEYRGYDSLGVLAYNKSNNLLYFKKSTSRIKVFKSQITDSYYNLALGHTRWATHGRTSIKNAHPQFDCSKNIFVVHNGIIENFEELKKFLITRGHKFISQTDTEVIPHLIEENLKKEKNYQKAVSQSLKFLNGSFALVIFNRNEPDKLIGAKFSSPLILGISKDGFVLASDILAMNKNINKVVYLDDGEMVEINNSVFKILNFKNNQKVNKSLVDLKPEIFGKTKNSYEHFMLKEIKEESQAIKNTLRGRIFPLKGQIKIAGLETHKNNLRSINKIIITGCGSAYYAALFGKYLIEDLSGIETEALVASELRYKKFIYHQNTLIIAISQSGETADTLEVLKIAKKNKVLTMGIVNVVGSAISRLVDFGIYTYAGPEYAVASTKAFSSQLVALVLTTLYLAKENKKISQKELKNYLKELAKTPDYLNKIFSYSQEQKIKSLAKKYNHYKNFLYLGRKFNYPIALEGALKLKEISYIHAEGYPAGEMKHGPIALIDKNFPIVVIAPEDSLYEKIISNLEEIKARNGKIIALTTIGNKNLAKKVEEVIYVPKTLEILQPILLIAPLHLFAYYCAKFLKKDIDRPRNLAKSVTVE